MLISEELKFWRRLFGDRIAHVVSTSARMRGCKMHYYCYSIQWIMGRCYHYIINSYKYINYHRRISFKTVHILGLHLHI